MFILVVGSLYSDLIFWPQFAPFPTEMEIYTYKAVIGEIEFDISNVNSDRS